MSIITITTLAVAALLMQDAGNAPTTGDDVVEHLRTQWTTYREGEEAAERRLSRDGVAQWATGALADVDVTTMTSEQIEDISWMINMVPAKKEALTEHLNVLAKAPTADGLQAAVLLARQTMESAADLDLESLMNHPGLQVAIDSGQASSLFTMMGYAPPEALEPHRDRLVLIADGLLASNDEDNVMAASRLIEGLAQEGVGLSRQAKLGLMDRAVTALGATADCRTRCCSWLQLDPENEMAERLRKTARVMAGPAARGELIGNIAPEVNFLWVSDGGTQTSLNDYRGKVVVLDYWATWCGPCVGSFPDVAKLQERYADHDVVILGVTSVQGRHYSGNGPPVDVEGDPEQEFELMQAFMGQQGITWTVAFSDDEVFDPEYGVSGIPHVVIIDTEGRVVENGLHPSMDPEHKHTVIDGLLVKAGKSHPEATGHRHPHDHDGDGHPDH